MPRRLVRTAKWLQRQTLTSKEHRMAAGEDLSEAAAALRYHEPTILTIVIQASFFLLLNVINWALDWLLYCGLVGQIFLGTAFGIPVANALGNAVETTVVKFGYLGLILFVYEGGLSTNVSRLVANSGRSVMVALTGILGPIGFSYFLSPISGATPLQCFAAGAALSATSLGTTFTILSTSGLGNTRLGTVLTSAAMMDDVIGLVMIEVVANLGETIDGAVVGRPIGASAGLLLLVIGVSRWIAKPMYPYLRIWLERAAAEGRWVGMVLWKGENTPFVLHTLLLLGIVSGAAWAGTSALFAAFLAGAAVSWWDEDVVGEWEERSSAPNEQNSQKERADSKEDGELEHQRKHATGIEVYEGYYGAVVGRLLTPLFFASIGFSIPITQMFTGPIVWRGIVYATLMTFSKFITGIWVLPWGEWMLGPRGKSKIAIAVPHDNDTVNNESTSTTTAAKASPTPAKRLEEPEGSDENQINTDFEPQPTSDLTSAHQQTSALHTTDSDITRSLYPPSIIGLAMVARGEIGFLIAAVAQSKGIFTRQQSSSKDELYIIVIWAIVICTIVGPVAVGTLVKRVKRLEEEAVVKREESDGTVFGSGEQSMVGRGTLQREMGGLESGVLGVWGVSGTRKRRM